MYRHVIIEYLKIKVRCQLIFTCIDLFEKKIYIYKLVLFCVLFFLKFWFEDGLKYIL